MYTNHYKIDKCHKFSALLTIDYNDLVIKNLEDNEFLGFCLIRTKG